jgi:hypothetical protein
VRGAQVRVTLQVVVSKTTLLGKGTKRKRVVQAIVLYQQGLRGAADVHGQFMGRLRIGYKPPRPVPASLNVSVEAAQGSATHTALVTILP